MNECSSVYQLISRLCTVLIKEHGEGDEGLSLQSAKRTAFEILLKNNYGNPESEKLLEELEFSSFELLLASRKDESQQINRFVDQVQENPQELEQICWLLLKLRNIDSGDSSHQNEKNFFTIPSNIKKLNKKNVYLPSKNTTKLIQLPSTASMPDDDCSFFSEILELYSGKKKINNQLPSLKFKPIEQPLKNRTYPSRIKQLYNWENLAHDDETEKSFSSESSTSVYLQLSASSSRTAVEIKTVSFEKLLNDLKLLIIGIESESFKRGKDDPLTFYMPNKLCCEGISDISVYVEEFLEAGTCFKRLKTFTSKNPFTQCYIFEGFILQAFCDCVIKFLNNFRDVVYSQEVESFLELTENTKSIRRILIHLTKFLKIHPSTTSKHILPNGSDFLGLLYNEYTTLFNHDVKCFFVECLKSCCQIYFNGFHKWLFQGYIEDPHNELFVQFVDHYRPNTKYFFDKAYLIRKQSVPGFLLGCADNILLCGKYTMLLKSYNQVHPLFMLRKHKLQVCLTNEEMKGLKAQSKEFAKMAREACGKSISIAKILHDREQAKKQKAKKAEVASMINIRRWRQEQEVARIRLAEKREAQLKLLQEELQRIEERKIVKRMEQIQAERDYLDGVEELENAELLREKEELEARIEIFKQLNEELDIESEHHKEIIVDLKSILNSKDDVLNANQEPILDTINTDEMNNVIPKTELTEAQRNRIKVMSHEFNNYTTESYTESTEEVDAPPTHLKLSDAQKNKLKVMGHEFGMIEPTTTPKIKVESEKLSDLQKNRIKVMSHEFHFGKETATQKKAPMTLSLLHVETAKLNLESPMSVTSDHFSNESDNQQQELEIKSSEEDSEKSHREIVDSEELELLRAFEEAVEKNSSHFMGINLAEYSTQSSSLSSYEHIKTTDTMALSRFLQMSLMVPVNSYMEILNNETLKMFVQDLDILSHFKSLRNYFLMMNGEFGSSICHQLFSKLESGVKPIELINYQSLHMILDQALCQTRYDPNIEKLSFIVQNIPEKFELHSPSVLNMITMSYKLDWPLNLILNPETMEQYKAIFNYLLKLKRISWVLEECYQILKELHKKHGKHLLMSQQFRNVQLIRHKMTHFVHCLENHVTRNVLQMSWSSFVDDLKSAHSIHCIYRKHTSYLKRVLFLCLLNKKSFEFQKTIEDAFRVVLKFQKHLKTKDWQLSGDSIAHPQYQKIQTDGEDFERLMKYVMYLGNKIIQYGYQKEICDLLYLIDINGYYSQT